MSPSLYSPSRVDRRLQALRPRKRPRSRPPRKRPRSRPPRTRSPTQRPEKCGVSCLQLCLQHGCASLFDACVCLCTRACVRAMCSLISRSGFAASPLIFLAVAGLVRVAPRSGPKNVGLLPAAVLAACVCISVWSVFACARARRCGCHGPARACHMTCDRDARVRGGAASDPTARGGL